MSDIFKKREDMKLHKFISCEGDLYGQFVVYYEDGLPLITINEEPLEKGWYWRNLDCGDSVGPFESAKEAYEDAIDMGV